MSDDLKQDAKRVKPPVAGALAASKRGWRTAPLPRLLKSPPPSGYLQSPLADRARISKWEAELPGRNYAVLPGLALTFIDVDVRDEKRGLELLAMLELEYGPLPKTFTVRTPSGGLHYYFRGLHAFKVGFRPGIDSPQYVVAPFSVLANGGRYEVIDSSPAAPMPNWLPEVVGEPSESSDADQVPAIALDQPANVAHAIYHLSHVARRSVLGRNGEYALLMTAGELKDLGISEPLAIELLSEHYNVAPICDPLWNIGDGPIADRLDVKVRNAWQYLTRTQPGAATAQSDFAGDDIPSPAELKKLDDSWKKRDRKSRLRRSVCFIDGVAYPVVRTGRNRVS